MSDSILERAQPPADARIRYGDDPSRFVDLRLPDGDGPYPAAIVIHGGYWRSRYTLDHLGWFCADLTAGGIATWSIEYRRVGMPGGGWPGSFHDVALAARFLFDNVARLGIDPARVVVTGHSAGGQLASWLASTGRVPPGSPVSVQPLPFAAAIPIAGVLDLVQGANDRLGNGAIQDLLGGEPVDLPDRYAATSPVALAPSSVPHILIHGESDDVVPPNQAGRYLATARAAGARVTLVEVPGADHFDVIDPGSPHWPTVRNAILDACGE